MKPQLFDQQSHHDLRLALLLERRLHGMQLLLSKAEREQPDVDPVQVVVNVSRSHSPPLFRSLLKFSCAAPTT